MGSTRRTKPSDQRQFSMNATGQTTGVDSQNYKHKKIRKTELEQQLQYEFDKSLLSRKRPGLDMVLTNVAPRRMSNVSKNSLAKERGEKSDNEATEEESSNLDPPNLKQRRLNAFKVDQKRQPVVRDDLEMENQVSGLLNEHLAEMMSRRVQSKFTESHGQKGRTVGSVDTGCDVSIIKNVRDPLETIACTGNMCPDHSDSDETSQCIGNIDDRRSAMITPDTSGEHMWSPDSVLHYGRNISTEPTLSNPDSSGLYRQGGIEAHNTTDCETLMVNKRIITHAQTSGIHLLVPTVSGMNRKIPEVNNYRNAIPKSRQNHLGQSLTETQSDKYYQFLTLPSREIERVSNNGSTSHEYDPDLKGTYVQMGNTHTRPPANTSVREIRSNRIGGPSTSVQSQISPQHSTTHSSCQPIVIQPVGVQGKTGDLSSLHSRTENSVQNDTKFHRTIQETTCRSAVSTPTVRDIYAAEFISNSRRPSPTIPLVLASSHSCDRHSAESTVTAETRASSTSHGSTDEIWIPTSTQNSLSASFGTAKTSKEICNRSKGEHVNWSMRDQTVDTSSPQPQVGMNDQTLFIPTDEKGNPQVQKDGTVLLCSISGGSDGQRIITPVSQGNDTSIMILLTNSDSPESVVPERTTLHGPTGNVTGVANQSILIPVHFEVAGSSSQSLSTDRSQVLTSASRTPAEVDRVIDDKKTSCDSPVCETTHSTHTEKGNSFHGVHNQNLKVNQNQLSDSWSISEGKQIAIDNVMELAGGTNSSNIPESVEEFSNKSTFTRLSGENLLVKGSKVIKGSRRMKKMSMNVACSHEREKDEGICLFTNRRFVKDILPNDFYSPVQVVKDTVEVGHRDASESCVTSSSSDGDDDGQIMSFCSRKEQRMSLTDDSQSHSGRTDTCKSDTVKSNRIQNTSDKPTTAIDRSDTLSPHGKPNYLYTNETDSVRAELLEMKAKAKDLEDKVQQLAAQLQDKEDIIEALTSGSSAGDKNINRDKVKKPLKKVKAEKPQTPEHTSASYRNIADIRKLKEETPREESGIEDGNYVNRGNISMWKEDPMIDLADGSGVRIKHSALAKCRLKCKGSGTMLMRFLLEEFFDQDQLSSSSAAGRGHAKRPPLDPVIISSLIAFVKQECCDVTEPDLMQAINQKCTDVRKKQRKHAQQAVSSRGPLNQL